MHRVKGLFEQVCSMRNLRLAAREALRGKRGKLPGAMFFAEMEKELPCLHEELRDGAYRHGPYHYFWIHDPKDRLVAAAPFRDRVVHHAIVRVIEPIFEKRFIEDSFACRRGKGTHAAMRRALHFVRGHRYALKCDVSKYFPSIDHEVLMRLVEHVIGDRGVLGLVDRVLASHADGQVQEWAPGAGLFDYRTRRRGLPIGNLTSQFLANVYLNPLDHFIKHDLRVRGYLRYMDDFLLFGDDRRALREFGASIKDKLAQLRLRMHPDDTWTSIPMYIGTLPQHHAGRSQGQPASCPASSIEAFLQGRRTCRRRCKKLSCPASCPSPCRTYRSVGR